MSPLLFRIALSAVLSLGSLAVIILRVSPLLSPGLAIPFFFLTLFLSTATVGALACSLLWRGIAVEGMDAGQKLTVSLREGIFLGLAALCLVIFQILGLLTWWIAILISVVFLLIELALLS